MPNSRRRKFSVKNGLDSSKVTHSNPLTTINKSQKSSMHDVDKHKLDLNLRIKQAMPDLNDIANTSENSSYLKIVPASRESLLSVTNSVRKQKPTCDKNFNANSSRNELLALKKPFIAEAMDKTKNDAVDGYAINVLNEDFQKKRDGRQLNRDSSRKEILRHHRVKVRSPRRRIQIPGPAQSTENSKITHDNNNSCTDKTSVDVVEDDVTGEHVKSECVMSTEKEERVSSYSIEDMCRICHGGETLCFELGTLVSACACRGTVGRVHVKCLEHWLTESGKSRCELCGTHYATRRIHRYGVPRGLVMWILSQNAKQLMVDTLGIMLMSPLAVLAAWLSGRTLAGLMMHESAATPWPLASTFVLACMTLVCYYCWIVSAATRHALGWWIWYRSHYEVRLDMQDNQE